MYSPARRITLVVKEKRQYAEDILRITWEGYTGEQASRWDWYFRYRAALAQVQHPRAFVELTVQAVAPPKKTEENILKDRVSSCLSTLSKHRNKVFAKREDWRKSDPMGLTRIEDLPRWPEVEEKTRRLESNLREAEEALSQFYKQ